MCSDYNDAPTPVEVESIYDPCTGKTKQVPKPSKKVSVTREEAPKPRRQAVAPVTPARREAC